MAECDAATHVFEVEDDYTRTPEDRLCLCKTMSWGEMNTRLLEAMWSGADG